MENKCKVIYYFSKDNDCYLAFAPELPGCCADGKNVKQAIQNLNIIINEWIDTATALNREISARMPDMINANSTDIFAVSKYILNQVGSMSTMTLEKLAYYCLVWPLVWYNKPLFANKFQAWKRGPVCKELFDIHKGLRVISEKRLEFANDLTDDIKRIVDCILLVYGNENGEFLNELTHNERPWIDTRGNISENANCEKIIDNKLIRESYIY